MNDLATPRAGQALDAALPRALRTPHRTIWILRQVLMFGVLTIAMPLEVALGEIIGLPGWVTLLLVTLLVGAWVSRSVRRTATALQEAVALTRTGDFEAAHARLEPAMRSAAGLFAASVATLLGALDIDLGRPQRGLAILESARRSKWFSGAGSAQSRAAMHACIATGLAEIDDHDGALRELGVGQSDLPPTQRGLLLADEVFVLARVGKHAEAQRCFAADIDAAEQLLPAWTIKWIRAVHAYSRATSDAGYRAAADDDVRGLLADHRARAALVRLGQRWPEFEAFLAMHGVQVR